MAENDADATQLFITEERKLFNRLFPTPGTSRYGFNNRHSHSSSSLPSSNVMELNSRLLKAESLATNAKLSEATEENGLLKRQIEEQKRLVLELQKEHKDYVRNQEKLVDEIAALRKEVTRGRRSVEEALNESATISASSEAELSSLRKAANKLYNYHLKDGAQLEMMKNILLQNKLWTTKTIADIRSSYLDFRIHNLDEDKISQFAHGSQMEFMGIDETEPPQSCQATEKLSQHDSEYDDELADLTTGSRFQGKVINDTMQLARKRSGSGPRRILSPIPSETSRFETSTAPVDITEASSICDQTMNSVDYENYEKIQTLEAENSQLRHQLLVNKSVVNKSHLLKEQKNDFENKYNFINKKFEETMRELCILRDATARNVFGSEDGRSHVDKMAAMHQKIEDLNAEVNKLKIALEDSERNLERAHSLLEDERMTSDSLRSQVADMDEFRENLENQVAELQVKLKSTIKEVDSLQGQVTEKNCRIEELLKQQASSSHAEPTDAGDTTQIYHVRFNPLETGHTQLKQSEQEGIDLKRKISGDRSSGEEDLEVKRVKIDEKVAVLEEQLRRAEQSKTRAVEIQSNFARRYREISTALTGYQIKMREEECQVISCLGVEPEDAFTFKYEDGNLMLLSRDDGRSEVSAQKWQREMDKYLGQMHSVPAFLSRVTISLAEALAEEQTLSQPSFSVIHDE